MQSRIAPILAFVLVLCLSAGAWAQRVPYRHMGVDPQDEETVPAVITQLGYAPVLGGKPIETVCPRVWIPDGTLIDKMGHGHGLIADGGGFVQRLGHSVPGWVCTLSTGKYIGRYERRPNPHEGCGNVVEGPATVTFTPIQQQSYYQQPQYPEQQASYPPPPPAQPAPAGYEWVSNGGEWMPVLIGATVGFGVGELFHGHGKSSQPITITNINQATAIINTRITNITNVPHPQLAPIPGRTPLPPSIPAVGGGPTRLPVSVPATHIMNPLPAPRPLAPTHAPLTPVTRSVPPAPVVPSSHGSVHSGMSIRGH